MRNSIPYNHSELIHESVIEAGLQDYMTKVYGWMALGLAITGTVCFYTVTLPVLTGIVYSSLIIPLIIGQVVLVIALSGWVQRMSIPVAASMFLLYSALNGLTLSVIFYKYTTDSLTNAFVTAALAFGALSLYGFTTKKNLISWKSFFFIGLIGVILAFVVEMFLHTGALGFAATIIGVLVFAGLTAYDSNRIKETYVELAGTEGESLTGRFAIRGALTLYLDFINLFLLLLRLFGSRK